MSVFDPKAFLAATYTEGIDTRRALHAPGEFTGHIGAEERDLQIREVTTKDGKRTVWDINLYADDQDRARDPNFPEEQARARVSLWLDLKPDGSSLDMSPGKNRDLGNLLTALGFQTKDGKSIKPWSPGMFRGMRLRYTVVHKAGTREGEIFDNVDKIAAV